MSVGVEHARKIAAQYWRVTLTCGHRQDVHSVRVDGPLFVLRCQTCDPGAARKPKEDRKP